MSKYPNDYISRQKLIEYANNSRVGIDANDIARFPAADVHENKHGRWVEFLLYPGTECVYCSLCRKEYCESDLYLGGNELPKYCPNCGAKMEVDGDE